MDAVERKVIEKRLGLISLSLFVVLTFVVYAPVYSQNYCNWFLETSDSILSFSKNPPIFVKPNTNLTKSAGGWRGCISDCKGKVQLYSNPQFLYNKFGDSIGNYFISDGNEVGGPSVFVPKPGNDSLYYHFYIVNTFKNSKYSGYYGELRYAEINALANNGAGQILKSKVVVDDTCDRMNLCLIRGSNRSSFWIMVTYDCTTVHCYKVDSSGVSSKPVVSTNVYNLTWHDVRKYYPWPNPLPNNFGNNKGTTISSSINGNKVICWSIPEAVNNYAGSAFIYDFNQATGKLSNGKSILPFNELGSNYTSDAACFSGDDSLIYLSVNPGSNIFFSGTKNYKLVQYNIKRNTRRVIRNTNNSSDAIFEMAIGNNGKIYGFSGTPYDNSTFGTVSIIHYPNKVGNSCNLQKPPSFPRMWINSPTPVDQLINVHSNLEYTTCVDTVSFSLLGDSNFSKLICHFGDGDSILIQKPENKIYSFKHQYKTEGRFTTEWEGLTAACGAPVWYTDTIDVKFAPRSIAKNVEIKQSPACTQSQIRLQDSVIHTTRYAIDWGDSSVQTFTVSAGVVAQMHSYLKPGVYTITVTLSNAWSCEKTYTYPINVRFLPQPQLAFSSNAAYCSGRTLQLTNDSAKTTDTMVYSYYSFSTMSSGKKVVSIPLQFGKDTVRIFAKNQYGCHITDTLILAVKPAVDASFSLSQSDYCVFETDTAKILFVKSGDTSIWHWNNTVYFTQDFPLDLNIVGKVGLLHIMKSSDGCVDTQYNMLEVHPSPDATFTGLGQSYCTGTQLQLHGKDTLLWYHNGNFEHGGKSLSKLLQDTGRSMYKAIAISEFGCKDSSSAATIVYATPLAKFSISDSTLCVNDTLELVAEGYGTGLTWRLGSLTDTGKIWKFSVQKPQGEYVVQHIASNPGGCYDTAYSSIEVQTYPHALFTNTTACQGQPITFNDNSTGSIAQRKWVIKQKTYTATPIKDSFDREGAYPVFLKVTSPFGCADSLTTSIQVYPLPDPKIFFTGHSYEETSKYEYYLEARPDTFVKYDWLLGSAGTSTESSLIVTFNNSNKVEDLQLKVTDRRNCTGIADTSIQILGLTGYYFPKAFTPNHDGLNEGFGIAGPEYVKRYKLYIFNRWGEVVFYTEEPKLLWVPENPLPGEYIYKAIVQDIYGRWEELEGIVILMR